MTKEWPLVSMVVPVYNVEEYLEECFDSIITQTYKNIEIFLINDGSTDNSGKIASKLAQNDSRVTVIHKENGGLSDARNAGMKIARGEYITFIDSDDYVDKNFVKNLVRLAEETDADIVQCNNSRRSDQLGDGSAKYVSMSGKDAFIELMKFKTVSPTAWGKLYRMVLFSNNDLVFPVGRLHEDTAVLYKLVYLANRVVCSDLVLYYYRMNSVSIMTASYTKKHYESVAKYHEELDGFIIKNEINIDKKVIYKHKALRLLSVLNKLALYGKENSAVYRKFKLEYKELSGKAHSLVCVIGIIPVILPSVFRGIKDVTPKIRKVLGKA